MNPLLEFNQVSQCYGDYQTLSTMSFQLLPGEIACLLGSSGCGKTTLLRCIAGFETPCGGEIRLNGDLLSTKRYSVPPHQRKIGMVFQDHALFPHLTVAANVAFGLHKLPRQQRTERVNDMLEIVGLSAWANHYPHELSGGQQQRVALARALSPRPQLLLLDEPFSSLDSELREHLSREVRTILKNQGITAIMVTHDQNEAFAIADSVGVIHNGQLQQWDTPYQVYHQPATRYVADFVGQGVFLPGKIVGKHCIKLEIGEFCGVIPLQFTDDGAVDVLLRPDDVQYDPNSPIRATVTSKVFRGAEFHYTLTLPSGQSVLAQVPSHHEHAIGDTIGIKLELNHLIAFPHI